MWMIPGNSDLLAVDEDNHGVSVVRTILLASRMAPQS